MRKQGASSRPLGSPFALLSRYQTRDPLELWDIKYRFKQLRIRLYRCDVDRLALWINGLDGPNKKRCDLCEEEDVVTVMDVVEHCCSDTHLEAMNGAVSAEAFLFWWRAVEGATAGTTPIHMAPAARSVPFPKVSAPPGVDPLALLESCYQAKRIMPINEIDVRFAELRARFDLCDLKRMVQQTGPIFGANGKRFKECSFCEVDVTFKMMIEHICSEEHLEAMDDVVCADAFDFWWNAVEAATDVARLEALPFEPESARWPELANGVKLTLTPPLHVNPSALLKSCEEAERKIPASEISTKFKQLLFALDDCDKTLIVKVTRAIFPCKVRCTLCDVKVDRYDVIEHFCSAEHLDEMDGDVCADAFDFWWNAVKEATPLSKKPQITPPPNVEPFALLQSCHIRFPLMAKSTIDCRFEELLIRFDRCDKKKLAELTSSLFEDLRLSGVKGCKLCKKYVKSIDDMIIHICDPDHIEKLNGDVCFRAFSFWWNAVKSVTPELEQQESIAFPQIFAPRFVDPFALLRSCHKHRSLMNKTEIKDRFEELLVRFDWCDKKMLAQQTSALFEKLRRGNEKGCTLCKKTVSSLDDMITHICDPDHINKMGGMVSLQAFNFWWKAVEEATTLRPEPDVRRGKKPAIVQKPQPEIKKEPEPEIKKKPEPEIEKKPEPEIKKKPKVAKKPQPAKEKRPVGIRAPKFVTLPKFDDFDE